jgi:hypothetical protein
MPPLDSTAGDGSLRTHLGWKTRGKVFDGKLFLWWWASNQVSGISCEYLWILAWRSQLKVSIWWNALCTSW